LVKNEFGHETMSLPWDPLQMSRTFGL